MSGPLVDGPATHLLAHQVGEHPAPRDDEQAPAPRQERDTLQERAQGRAAAEASPDLEQQFPPERWRASQTATLLAGSTQDVPADRPPNYVGGLSLSSKEREGAAAVLMT